ncbi:hypothetical protein Vafri_5121 [Volvox africanus]|uniref:SET domain-containing protein n=2 Tax=Volvox africanus TaxID=51714 RepID=A0A8J4EUM4_9CHLO|nr:hypothetical protein Vafri_5121 [Volvox africanus]
MLAGFSTADAGNAAPAGASVSDSTTQGSAKATTSTSALPQTDPCGSEPQLQPSGEQALLLGLAPTPHPPPSAAELLAPMLERKPFTVAKIPGRGRGLLASRAIPRGEVVQREAPLLAFPELGGTHAVCYHCLSPLALSSSPVRHPGPNGRRFCCDACMEAALGQYLEVEEATAAAAAAAATRASSRSNSSSDGDGGNTLVGGSFAQLYEQCRQHRERFPLMAARLAFMEVSEAVRRYLVTKLLVSGPCGHSGNRATTSATGAAADVPPSTRVSATPVSDRNGDGRAAARGDPLRGFHVLCFANMAPPFPAPWVEQHGLLAAALHDLAMDRKALRNLALAMGARPGRGTRRKYVGTQATEGDRFVGWRQMLQRDNQKQQPGGRVEMGPRDGAAAAAPAAVAEEEEEEEDEGEEEALLQGLAWAVSAAVEERLNVEWFVGVMSRLHLNVFQVHNPLAGADPSDLAAAAAALVSDTAGGASSGSAVYLLASLFNHSCEPTLELSFPGLDGTAAFTAARDIAPGEELCVSYLDIGLPVHVRRQHLEWSYGFVCGCPRCREEEEVQETGVDKAGRS